MQRSDLCKILGVSVSASKEECKKAFHKLAHLHHPDKGGDVAIFKKINGAYQELMKLLDRGPANDYPFEGSTFDGMAAQKQWNKDVADMMNQVMREQQAFRRYSYSTNGSSFSYTIHFN